MMKYALVVAGLSLKAAAASLQPWAFDFETRNNRVESCGADYLSPQLGPSFSRASRLHSNRDVSIEDTIDVEVFFHAALYEDAAADHVNEEKLTEQFNVLADAYEPHGIRLNLQSISRDLNDSIAEMSFRVDGGSIGGSTPAIEEFWKRTRTGPYRSLHVYFYERFDNFIGICSFPDVDREESEYWLDACHVTIDSLPGSADQYFNLGKATVHEVGHWFGLFHVFSGGCLGDGDFVDDTPAQEQSPPGCAAERDSCPDQPGVDSIHNYMDYTADACWEEFTPGQVDRMHSLYEEIRAIK